MIPFINANKKFKTNTEKGFAHSPRSNIRGSVLEEALHDDDDGSLWLEYAIGIRDDVINQECFWLMWYNKNGSPLSTSSAVFNKEDLVKMINLFKKIEIKDIQI